MAFQFTSGEWAGGLAFAAIGFDCTKIKSLCWRSWRTSGEPIKAMLEEVSYA